MEGVRTFLESSTIHGLTYISTTRKYARLFWILVVITGFVGASLLIKESFDSWSKSPVKTTIKTLPISGIKLPKVTVCPPKNTYTDLNYDLMMTENITVTEKMRDDMFKYALEVINENVSQNVWNKLHKLHEEDRFYNWYHGYTRIKSPFYDNRGLIITIESSATSGVVTTQYYGEKFRPELVERKLYYMVRVNPPKSLQYSSNFNVTMHFKVEKVSMTGLVRQSLAVPGKDSIDRVWVDNFGFLEFGQTTAYQNYIPCCSLRFIALRRDVSSEDVGTQKLKLMPGFRFSWWYTGAEFTPDNKYKDNEINRQFVR